MASNKTAAEFCDAVQRAALFVGEGCMVRVDSKEDGLAFVVAYNNMIHDVWRR